MRRFRGVAVFTGLLAGGVLFAGPVAADNLDMIHVESTTIDDRFEQKRGEPSSIAAIRGETVDTSRAENIQQLLQAVPGITTEIQGGDSLKIHIRGVENQVYMGEKPGVAIVIDGVPVFERTGRVNIDLDNIESIRVIKGGASYLFGDDALSGAVIITTKRGAGQAGYRLGAEAGAHGYRKGLARVGVAGERASAHLQLSRREADGYHDDSAYRADYLNGNIQYYLSDESDLTFGFENSRREKNSHGTVRGVTAAALDPKSYDPAYNDYANRYDVDLGKYHLTYYRDVGAAGNLLVNGYYFTDHTKFFSSPIRQTDDYNYFNDYEQIQRGVKSEYRTAGEQAAWMAGAEFRDNSYENRTTVIDNRNLFGSPAVGSDNNNNEVEEQVKATYGELKFRLANPLTITLNARFDRIDLDYSDNLDAARSGTKSFEVASWRGGINYAVRNNLDLYGNISTGFRAPDANQLFVGSSTPTSRVDANPDLDPEHSLNLELGLRTRAELAGTPLELDLSIFQLDRSDHIRASAGQYTTGTDNVYDNVGDMRHRGLELSLRSDPARDWSWDLAYTYLDAWYTSYENFHLRTCATVVAGRCAAWDSTVLDNTDNRIPRVPEHRLNLMVNHRPAPGWIISAEMSAISSYYADETNLIEISGHQLYNLLVNYDLRRGRLAWSFFGRIDNLLDKRYYTTARGNSDQNYDGVFDAEDISITVNPGRIWTAGVEVKF